MRIIIVGGGFAGIKCAQTLCKTLSKDEFEIVLFNHENHMVFQPLLAEVVSAAINPNAIAVPIRNILSWVKCRTEEVKAIKLDESCVEYLGYDGHIRSMSYDHIVIACGTVVNLALIPGMANHAFPLRTVGDAIKLRHHIIEQLEIAEVCDDTQRKCWYLSFIIIGGGFSGVEVAGEINDLVHGVHKYFPNINVDDIKVSIIHSRDHILPEMSTKLREIALSKMRNRGLNIVLNSRVSAISPEGVQLKDGNFIGGGTIVCTIGNSMSPVVQKMNVHKQWDRLVTEKDMRISGYKNAWSVGDCAYIVNNYNNEPSPATGQFAERQGKQVAENIVRYVNGKDTLPFSFKPLGQLCSIGGHNAIAEMFGLHISGFLVWILWRNVYLFKLGSWSKRIKVAFDWTWDLFFPRDMAHPKTDLTDRVSKAHYNKGEYIFRQGDPGNDFYIIERGEVEVIRETETSDQKETIGILGKGDFFGEMALINDNPRNTSIIASTDVECVVMGRKVFMDISNTLTPFYNLLVDSIKNRT